MVSSLIVREGVKWHYGCECSIEDWGTWDGLCEKEVYGNILTKARRRDVCNDYILTTPALNVPHIRNYRESILAKARSTTVRLFKGWAEKNGCHPEVPETITDKQIQALREPSLSFGDLVWLDKLVGRLYRACFASNNPIQTSRGERLLFVQLRDALIYRQHELHSCLNRYKDSPGRIKKLKEQVNIRRLERIDEHLSHILTPQVLESLDPEDRICAICREPMNHQPPGETPIRLPCPGEHILGSDCARKVLLMASGSYCPYDRCPLPLGEKSMHEMRIDLSIELELLWGRLDTMYLAQLRHRPTPDWLRALKSYLPADAMEAVDEEVGEVGFWQENMIKSRSGDIFEAM